MKKFILLFIVAVVALGQAWGQADLSIVKVSDAAEPSTNGQFKIVLSAALATDLVVDLSYSGTAISGTDYQVGPTSVTIPALDLEKFIDISVLNDNITEDAESVTVTISTVSAEVTVVTNYATLDIKNDDAIVTLSVTAITETDANFSHNFVATLDKAVQNDVVLSFSTTEGSATSGSDFTGQTAALYTITAGQTQKEIPVNIIGDLLPEPSETFTGTIAVNNANGQTISLGTSTVTATITDNDAANVSLSVTAITETEANFSHNFIATLDKAVQNDVVLSFSTTEGSATSGSDFTGQIAALYTITAGQTQKEIPVNIIGDLLPEPSENFTGTIAVSNANGQQITIVTGSETATATITDNDAANLNLSVSGITETNADFTHNFIASIDKVAQEDVVITFTTSGIGATQDVDYVGQTGATYTIEAGETSINIPVVIKGDLIAEASETFTGTIVVSNANGQTINNGTTVVTATITDNDAASFTIGDISIGESGGSATFTVTLGAAVQGGASVKYATDNGTALAGSDYTAISNTLNFTGTSGETKTFSVLISNNTIAEPTETFVVNLSDATGTGVSIADNQAVGTITDDDAYTISLSGFSITETDGTQSNNFVATMTGEAQNVVNLTFSTSDGNAKSGSDYTGQTAVPITIGAGTQSANIPVSVLGDLVSEPQETFSGTITLGDVNGQQITIVTGSETATATITDNDAANLNLSVSGITETNADFTHNFIASIDKVAQEDVVITFTTSGIGATQDVDYVGQTGATYTIEAGETSINIPVVIKGDLIAEASETFTGTIVVSNANGQTINNGTTVVTATITDNDAASFTIGDISIGESGGSATFTVTLGAAVQGGASVKYATDNGTALAGSDYTAISNTLNFTGTSGETKTFSVLISNNTIAEPTETFVVNLSDATGTGVSIADNQAVGTITDDDAYTISLSGFSITETDGTQSNNFVATMTGEAQNVVNLTFSTSDGNAKSGSDYTGQTAVPITIGAGTQSANIPVSVLGDLVSEPQETFSGTITLGDVNGQQITIVTGSETATATITDNDAANLNLSVSGITETNADFTHNFIASIDKVAQEDVVITFTTSGIGATQDVDYIGQTGVPYTIEAGETSVNIPVVIKGDLIAEASETFTGTVAVSNANGQTINNGTTVVTATITDNDAASFTIGDISIAESGGAATFIVTLGAAVQGGATVKYATADGTALAGSDYTAISNTLNFTGTSGETKTFSVSISNNTIAEPSETFVVNLSDATGTGVSIADNQAVGTITDDDTYTISLAGFTVTETDGAQTKNFVASMTGVAQDKVDLTFTTSDGTATSGSDYTAQAAKSISLTGGEQTLNIPVEVLGDQLSEPEETFGGTIALANANGQQITILSGTATATATITDDDVANVGITKVVDKITANVGENVTFTITVNNVGPKSAFNVKATDVLPSGYTFVSATPSVGTWSAPDWTIGTLAANASVTLQIVATVNASGNYTNTVTVSSTTTDPDATNNTATASITSVPVTDLVMTKTVDNDEPKIGDDVVFTLTVKNDGPSNATGVVVTDVLPDGYTYKSHTGEGTYDSGTGKWTINALNNGVSKTLSITATIKLGTNYLNTASVSGTETDPVLTNNQASASVTVQNSAPVAVNDTYTTQEDVSLNVPAPGLLANDYDVNADAVTVSGFEVNGTPYTEGSTAVLPLQGSLTINADGSLSFVPVANFNGNLPAITYTITDGELTATGNVTIAVTAVNDAPVAVPDAYTTVEDTPLSVTAVDGLLKNDSDVDGDDISVTKFKIGTVEKNAGETATVTQGTLTVLANGSFTFAPALNFNGSVSGITYTIADGSLTASSTMSITVTAVNDPPVANPDYLYTSEGGNVGNFNVLSNDNDAADGSSGGIDPNSLKITKQPENGSLIVLTNKLLSYTPNQGFYGTDQAEYEICDLGYPNSTINCVKGIIYIDVTRLSPLANEDVAETDEDTPVDINVVANDEDVNINPSTVVIVTKPTHGTATHQGSGIVRYVPVTNYNGTDYFTYTVKDHSGLISNIARVDVTINPVADTPVSTDGWYSTKENVAVIIPIHELVTDPDNDINFSTIVIAQAAGHGTVTGGSNPGELLYTPNAGYAGNDSFQYNVADATALRSNTSTVTIQVSNQAPTAVDDDFSVNEDEPTSLNVITNDTDPQDNIDPTAVSIVTPPANGTVTVNAVTGAIEYTSALDYHGSDSFIYRVCDATGYCDEATVDVTVLPVNDAPVAVADTRTLQEDNSVFIDVLSNDYDVDNSNSELTIIIVSQPSAGTVQVASDPDGIVYTPDLNFNGSDNFTYQITDPDGLTGQTTVDLTITPVNDPPQPANDSYTGIGSAGMTLDVLANDTDPENNINPASVSVTVVAQHGQTTVKTNGTVVYIPDPAYFGPDGFTYSVCDTEGACAEAQVTLWVTAGNGPPQANDDEVVLNEDVETLVNPLINDTDPNNNINAESLSIIQEPAHGSIEIINISGDLLYTPDADFYGTDNVVYKVCDSGEPALCTTATIFFTINAVNDAPHAADDVINTTDMSVTAVNAMLNDIEVEGEAMVTSLVTISPSLFGEFTISATGDFEYTAYPGAYCNTDIITYQVCDPLGACSEAEIYVHIMPLDSDGDGIPDFVETTTLDTNNDNTPDYLSLDSDGDGIPDSEESGITDVCVDDTPRDTDGDLTPDYRDLDSDDDGVPDAQEGTGDCDSDGIANYIDRFDDCGNRLNIPATFSPNGDGFNDQWVIQGVRDFQNNELSVFNRWGSLVYHKKPYDNTWDGKASANVMGPEDLPEGTYYYILILDNQQTLKGSVYIKR